MALSIRGGAGCPGPGHRLGRRRARWPEGRM